MKRLLFIRLLLLVLSIALICGFAACADEKDPNNNTSADLGSDNPDDSESTDGFIHDTVPTDILDYNATITILTWADVEHEEFTAEEGPTGEPINDGIYKRNLTVEERLGIDLEFISTDGDSGETANWLSYVRNSLQSGSNPFDLMASYSLSIASSASNGFCYNLLDPDCEYLNFDMPWWPDRLITEATINDKLYFASGDISANALYMMYVCYVNTDIIEDMELPNVYELVDNNQWTYEKFIEMCQGVYYDNDGNGEKSVSDRFGYMTATIHMDPWFYGSGALIIDKDSEGNLRMSPTFGGEKVISSLEMLNNLLHNTNDGMSTGSTVNHQAEFNNGNLLFTTDRARIAITKLIAEDLNFAIVPFAKYDENQDDFATAMGNPFTLYAIPIDATEEELPMLSAVLEVYASESYRQLTPALYETSLKIKYVQDEDSARMYDIVRENLSFDLGRIFSKELVGQTAFRNAVLNNAAGSWQSVVRGYTNILPKLLDKLIQAYEG